MKTAVASLAVCLFALVQASSAAPKTRSQLLADQGLKDYDIYSKNFKKLETTGFRQDPAATEDSDWFAFWKSQISPADQSGVTGLRYYLRLNPSKVTDANYTSFDNVKRVMRIMPKAKFDKMFPNSTSTTTIPVTNLKGTDFHPTGATEYYWHAADTVGIPRTRAEIFSYENFLKAVAILPGFCGSYESYPDPVLKPILEKNADLIARKLLATVFAHAVQETSDSGSGNTPAMQQKLKGVFANIVENKALVQLPEKDGVFGFAGPGAFFPLTLTGEPDHAGLPVAHSYAGRGIKQTSYPTNYANAGLFLFGDLRLLAYPELLEEPGVMGFLSGLVYAMLPKDGNPSIVEVMDGTYHRKLEEFSKTYGKDPGFEKFRETYDLEFPLTILLVNGGPECDGNRSINKIVVPKEMTEAQKDALRDTINNNTKIRIEAYNYFVQTEDLLGPVDAGSAPATTPAFVPESSDATVTLDGKTLPNGSHYIPKTTAVAANESYNLTGNLDSCLLLMTNTLNKTPGEEAITAGQVTHTVDTSGFTDAWVAKNCTDVWAGSYIQVGNTLYKAVQTGRAATKKADFLQAAPDITVIRPWETLFIRPLYYGPKWSGSDEMKVQASSGGNLPIFGGEKVKTLLEAASK